jgi:hypothetical protein
MKKIEVHPEEWLALFPQQIPRHELVSMLFTKETHQQNFSADEKSMG